MAWASLMIAGFLEVVWAAAMKESAGFSKIVPSVITIVAMIASVGFLAYSVKYLPLGVAYTVWTGIGAVGSFLIGVLVFGEIVTASRLTAVCLIIAGLIIMKLSSH